MFSPPGPCARRLAVLAVLAFALRAAFLVLEPATPAVGDERTWTDWARNVSSERVGFSPMRHHMIFHPPVYAYFLGALFAPPIGFQAAKWVQAMLSAGLVVAVGRVGMRLFSPEAGLGAATVMALYPELVWFSSHFWSEIVFLFLLWWAIERLLAADADESAPAAVLAGLLWGLGTLTRETIFYFMPVAACWLAFRRGPSGGRRAALFLLSAVLVIAPWTYRNWRAFHAFVPVSTAGGQNLFQGNSPLPRDETYLKVDAVQGRVEQYRYAMRMGLEAIRDRQPGWIFEKLYSEIPRLWEADSLVLIHIKRGAYGEVAPAVAVATAVVVLTPYVGLLGLFAVGVASLGPNRGVILLLVFFAYYNLIHVVTHGFCRYRLPIMPIVFLIAAAAWAGWRSQGAGLLPTPQRRAAALALVALFIAIFVPSFRLNIAHPAFGLTDDAPSGQPAPP